MAKDKNHENHIESLISEEVASSSTTERTPGKDRLIKTDQFQLGAGRILPPAPRVSGPMSRDSSVVQSAVRAKPAEPAPSGGSFTLGIVLGIVLAIGIGVAAYFWLWP